MMYYQGCSHVQKIGARTPAPYYQRQTCQLPAKSRVQVVKLRLKLTIKGNAEEKGSGTKTTDPT